jgi:hypothetical protein
MSEGAEEADVLSWQQLEELAHLLAKMFYHTHFSRHNPSHYGIDYTAALAASSSIPKHRKQ